MDIWDSNKLLLFIAFVVPGFISLKIYQILFPSTRTDASMQIVDAISYSSINYALLLWPIYLIESNDIRSTNPNLYIGFYVFVLLIAPIVWAFLLKKLRSLQCIQSHLPHPTGKPWDYVLNQRKPYWIVVTLKDGIKIGGKYSDKSFASNAPEPEQLYLEETWVINANGGFERPKELTAGVIVLSSEISTVEFYHFNEGEADVRAKQSQRRITTNKQRVSTRSTKAK